MTELPVPDAMAVRAALGALSRARTRVTGARPHRGLVRLDAGPYIVQALLLPAMFIALLLRFEPQLVETWRVLVMTGAQLMDLPLRASTRPAGLGELRVVWMHLETASVLPDNGAIAISALLTLAVFAATLVMPARMVPVKYLLRIACVVQAVSTAFFAFGGELGYDIADHVLALSSAGFVLLAGIPMMLAMGYYVLRMPLVLKIGHTTLILGYFVLLVPVELLAHVVLLHHLGVIAMPLLYFCFGALLNFVLFVGLYSWLASRLPAGATLPAPVSSWRGSPRSRRDRPASPGGDRTPLRARAGDRSPVPSR